MDGLFDIRIVSFVFTPLAVTVSLLLCPLIGYFMIVMHFVAGGLNGD